MGAEESQVLGPADNNGADYQSHGGAHKAQVVAV